MTTNGAMPIALRVLAPSLEICRFPADAPLPSWAMTGPLFSITRRGDECSVVCPGHLVPVDTVRSEGPFRALEVVGPLDFSLTGILVAVATPLAEAKVSIFAISTFDTDLVLVRSETLEAAVTALRDAGFTVEDFAD